MNELVARELWEYDQVVRVEWLDIFGSISMALLLLFGAFVYQNRKAAKEPAYKFYFKGLAAKMLGSMAFCCIYIFYYDKHGDTIAYFESSMALANLFFQDAGKYFEVMFSAPSIEIRSLFSDKTGYPYSYLFYDDHTFNVIKLTSILAIFTGRSYFLSSLLLSYVSYFGIWKLFLVFRAYAPAIEKKLAWAMLYFPSPLFWAGGISKETYIFSATAMFVYCAHRFFILKERKVGIIILLLIGAWLIINIKPYIFIVLFPGGLLWVFYDKLTRVRSKLITYVLFPVLIVGIIVVTYFVLSSLSGSMSKFSIDNAFETAAVTSNDLKKDYYEGSSFDIGTFDGSNASAIRLILPAINAGLFRPFVWESGSVVLLMAGIENAFLLFFTLYILYQTKIKGTFKIISKNPILLFCIVFTIFFAFMIGITTSNFGALVRFKIPILPFFVSALFMIDHFRTLKEYRDY